MNTEETNRRLYQLEEDISDLMDRVGDQQSRQIDLLRRVVGMKCILNAMGEYREPLTLLQKLSRWWNRSHYRALEQQLSELRESQMKTDEAVQTLTGALDDQSKTIENQGEGIVEINGLIAELKAEIDALKSAGANVDLPANIAQLITSLAEKSKLAKDRSQEIADIVKPVEPPPAG